IDLVAGDVRSHGRTSFGIVELALVLEGEVFVVDGEVSFGVLSAEGELANVFQMLFIGKGEAGLVFCWRVRRGLRRRGSAVVRDEKHCAECRAERENEKRPAQARVDLHTLILTENARLAETAPRVVGVKHRYLFPALPRWATLVRPSGAEFPCLCSRRS